MDKERFLQRAWIDLKLYANNKRGKDSSFDMLSGYGIDSVLNVTDTVMDLCRDYRRR